MLNPYSVSSSIAAGGLVCLNARSGRQTIDGHGCDEKRRQCKPVGRLGDRQRIQWRKEEKVVAEGGDE
jgi:hypothetical protein